MKVTPEGVEAMVVTEIDNPLFIKRSAEYRAGVKDCLLTRFCGFRFGHAGFSGELHPAGTVQFDAYEAGHERGWAMYRAWQAEHQEVIL